jgi:hypothetical protein
VTSTDVEFALVALGAMLSPTTLSFSVLALVLGDRPRRTGLWFYVGALSATLAIGVLAAFVIGDIAASSSSSTPRTWVLVVDVVAGVLILAYAARMATKPPNPGRAEAMIAQMGKIASSPAIAIVAAGATLANPGGFIPLALKDISQTNPTTAEFILDWVAFALISLLPLALAILMLAFRYEATVRFLNRARGWLEHHARTVFEVILVVLAVVLLRNGIAGLVA